MAGSKSRGTARSNTNSGRSARNASIRRYDSSVTIGSAAPVVLITRSASVIAAGSSSHGRARPLHCRANFGALEVPIDDRYPACALVAKISQRFFGHFAGADHQRLLVVEAFEYLPGEIGHCHAGNAHAALVDGRFGGHAAGDADRRLKCRVQQRAGVVAIDRRLVCLLHLGQNLRLAHHHAVQAGGHGEQVPHGVPAGEMVKVRQQFGRIQLMEAGQEAGHLVAGGCGGRLACGVDFHPVASRQEHRFLFLNTRRQWSNASPVCSGPKAIRSRMAIDVPWWLHPTTWTFIVNLRGRGKAEQRGRAEGGRRKKAFPIRHDSRSFCFPPSPFRLPPYFRAAC